MLVLTRHRLPLTAFPDPAAALAAAREVLAALAERPGYLRGWVGRAVDDGDVLLLAHEWADTGSYRRALSAYEVKLHWPFLQTAVDEPTAFEVLSVRTPEDSSDRPSDLAADAGEVGLGSAAAAEVPRGAFG